MYEILRIESNAWKERMRDVIAVRVSAYEEWNGAKSEQEQSQEADSWLAKILGRKNAVLYIAEREGQTLGYLWGFEKSTKEFYISHIGVRQDLKRRGIGRALIGRCEKDFRDQGYEALTTSTYSRFKNMLGLLAAEGYAVVGTTKPDWAADERIEFRKELAPTQ